MCITETVYRNLLECGDCYPQEYMAELAAEEHPLGILSYFYEKSGRFQIESEANDLLGIIVHNRDDLDRYEKLDPKAAELTGHAERMELLDANLDREFAALSKEWDSLDFDAFCGKGHRNLYAPAALPHAAPRKELLYGRSSLTSWHGSNIRCVTIKTASWENASCASCRWMKSGGYFRRCILMSSRSRISGQGRRNRKTEKTYFHKHSIYLETSCYRKYE